MAVRYAQESRLAPEEYVAVLERTTMRDRRPLANLERIGRMLAGANVIVTAREEDGTLVGLARCISDGAWICYCAELAVRDTHQGRGIGRALLETTADLLGPGVALTLNAEPEAVDFYRHMGMQGMPAFFIPRTDRS